MKKFLVAIGFLGFFSDAAFASPECDDWLKNQWPVIVAITQEQNSQTLSQQCEQVGYLTGAMDATAACGFLTSITATAINHAAEACQAALRQKQTNEEMVWFCGQHWGALGPAVAALNSSVADNENILFYYCPNLNSEIFRAKCQDYIEAARWAQLDAAEERCRRYMGY